jgi:hypothetical protein
MGPRSSRDGPAPAVAPRRRLIHRQRETAITAPASLRAAIAACALLLAGAPALGGSANPREAWAVHDTDLSHDALLERTRAAIREEEMYLVTEAGPTGAAAGRGIEIPGNRVLGVFRNDHALRAVRLSVPAMIEAPIRLHVTEDAYGTATRSRKTPGHVLAPHMAEGRPELRALAQERDAVFARIAEAATER